MSWEAEMTRHRMGRGLKIGIEQEQEEDWSRIDKSTYFPTYKRIKEATGRENYFDRKNVKESERKIWTVQNVETHIISEDTKRIEKKEKKTKGKKKMPGENWKIN